MARVPVVESPCPIAGKQLPTGATEHCALCERPVHNLDRMNERERIEFMSACGGKVCIAYTVRRPSLHGRRLATALAGAAAASMMSLPAAATDDPLVPVSASPPSGGMSPVPGAARELPHCEEEDWIIVGGVSKADQAEWTDDGKDAPPELPTIEDDGR
jgi:hypothetical protein